MSSCLCPSQSKETQNHPEFPGKSAFFGGSPLNIPCHCCWDSGDINITRERNQSNQNCASMHTTAFQGPREVLGVILHSLLGVGRKAVARGPIADLINSSF